METTTEPNTISFLQKLETFISVSKNQIEDERKEIAECQKKFSNLVNGFSQKAPSSSIINTLYQEDEPEGFVFSKYEEKRKQLAEQRRAEYNAFLEKKEAERLAKKRSHEEKRSFSPKSILDGVDYERVLAKRKEEEAKFRTINVADVLHSSKPVLKQKVQKPPVQNAINLEALERENARLFEERIVKHLEEQQQQMLRQFENEIKKQSSVQEEMQNFRTPTPARNTPERVYTPREELPKFGRTGGGGEPVKDHYGNMITMRGLKKESNSDYGSILSFPSMQEQNSRDRTAMYREELKRQIEEKKRLEALEKAKARDLEDRIAQRIEEQRLRDLQQFEKEQMKNNKITEEFLRQQQRLRQLEEFQRKDDEERRRKMAEARPPPPEPRPIEIPSERSNSPPIPAVRTKVLLEKAVSPLHLLKEVKSDNTMSSLAEIRRKIREEQKKLQKEHSKSYEVMNRRTVQEVDLDEDEDDILKTSYQSIF